MGWRLRTVVARIRGLLRPGGGGQEFDEEIEAHLAMATEEKVRQGMTPREAYRQARLELGNLTQLKEAHRDQRGVPHVYSSWLDIKLALRMLRKSWGLTLVAGFAMMVVIGLAAFAFEIMGALGDSDLPLDEGDRVVSVRLWDPQVGDGIGATERDLAHWRDGLRALAPVGGFRMIERNLETTTSGDGADVAVEAVVIAEMSASGFEVARVPPLRGRALLPEDELPAAPPVLVIGHEVWQTRFAGDPAIVGRDVRIDGTIHTIVGVMPASFQFPIFHRYWTPLRVTPVADHDDLIVFGRLATGATIARAQNELRALGRAPDRTPTVDEARIELRVEPYVKAFVGEVPTWLMSLILFFMALLLLPPAINIAVLVYARTVSRQGEFAARFVLGASRTNIVLQLFIEILVLALGAGAVALLVANAVIARLVENMRARDEPVPFWIDFGLSPKTILVVFALAVLAALVAGAVPAIRATGASMQSGLRALGGQTPVRLGRLWTAMIVLQVAFSFALLPSAVELTWGTIRTGLLGPGFAADRYLTAKIDMARIDVGVEDVGPDETGARKTAVAARYVQRRAALARALEADPGVEAVAFSSQVVGGEDWRRVELESDVREEADLVASSETRPESQPEIRPEIGVGTRRLTQFNHVDQSFFDIFDLRMLAGRTFEGGDFGPLGHAVVVNRSFARAILGDEGNPLGQRFRYASGGDIETPGAQAEPWLEIVGVVEDLEPNHAEQTVYHPARSSAAEPVVFLALRFTSDATRASGTLRSVTWSVDPAMRASEIARLGETYKEQAVGNYLGASALVAATLAVLLLSAAGIYALMSFTVNRRRKEIGIRSALGAQSWRLVVGILGGALKQVGLGALGGTVIALVIGYYIPVEAMGGWNVRGIIPAAAGFIMVVGLLSAIGPVRRGLRVDPIEELRES